jgi:polar amino acid transport system ATP-binding protein/sulfate transport system ATP-binding protein
MTDYEYKIAGRLITIDDVCLKFGDTIVLNHVEGKVDDIIRPGMAQGQVIGILGPSGIGKTQLSKILAGLQKPTSGRVLIHNKHVQEVEAGLVGMVAQNYPLFRHRTVMGNLLIAATKAGLSAKDAKAKATEYLATFDLSSRADVYPCQLSGGQRQRVAIIQQILCSEHYLVMDEPFTGLDPVKKDQVCELINKVATMHEENTVFIVAHDLNAVASIADTLWLVGRDRDPEGKIIQGAKIQAVYDLIERGLAWRPNIACTPQFAEFVAEVKQRFYTL